MFTRAAGSPPLCYITVKGANHLRSSHSVTLQSTNPHDLQDQNEKKFPSVILVILPLRTRTFFAVT